MKHVRIALLALLVAVGSLQGLAVHTPRAEAAVTKTYYSSGAFFCGLNACKVTVNGQFSVIDNSRVKKDWGGCQLSWSNLVTIDFSWNSTYTDPSNRWIEVGCNFTVYAIYKGFPMAVGYYLRLRAYPSGYSYSYWGRL